MYVPTAILRPSALLLLTDLLLGALERATLAFPATEARRMPEPGYVTAVEPDVTVLLDQGADAPGSPQLGAKAVGHGTLQLFSSSMTIFLHRLLANAGGRRVSGDSRSSRVCLPSAGAAGRSGPALPPIGGQCLVLRPLLPGCE